MRAPPAWRRWTTCSPTASWSRQEAERHYREQVLRMPDGYLCYDPPETAPPVGPLPALKQGFATFGSFNNPAKITPEVVAVWAEILRRAPTARLVLKYRGLGRSDRQASGTSISLPPTASDSQRLELLPWSSYADYLATYHQVDLALDPFPFSGSSTTCEALWMGVPVVTCPGETFASRHSLSHLSNVGLTETIAQRPGRVRGTGRFSGRRPAATGRAAGGLAGADGCLAALRWEAICGQFGGGVARHVEAAGNLLGVRGIRVRKSIINNRYTLAVLCLVV